MTLFYLRGTFMLTIILGSAIGFFCSLSLIVAVSLLIVCIRQRKLEKQHEVILKRVGITLKGDKR